MADADKQQLVADTARLWREIRHAMEERDPSPWMRMSLSRGQLRILALLSATPQMSPGSVAAALGVPKANVTEIIERLVGQGLVQREPNLQDRRSHNLALTPRGKTEIEQLREWNTRRIEKVLDKIPGDKLEALAQNLKVMYEAARSMPSEAAASKPPVDNPEQAQPDSRR